MRRRGFLLAVIAMSSWALASGQTSRRIAVVEANGPLARMNPFFALAETNVTNALTSKLAGQPGITVVDRASIDKLLKEQNFQNSDRSSADSAARIGKLLGTQQIVLVQLDGASYTTHDEQESSHTTRNTGTVQLNVSAKLIDVESGVILLAPGSSYKDSVTVGETTITPAVTLPYYVRPAKTAHTGGDPQVIQNDEWAKAGEAVTQDLAMKLKTALGNAPQPKAASALVAGIANGSVYISEGSKAGVKAGDRFQVVREVATGLTNPTTGKPIVHKQQVCVLTVSSIDEDDASGSCQGGLPQKNDVAEPMQP